MSTRFLAPRSLAEAIDAVADEDAVTIAGGVAVGLLANLGLVSTRRLVSVARVPELRGVRVVDDEVVLGASTTHAALAADPALRSELPVVAAMFGRIGNVRVRAWGTVGGNLALGEPAQDPPVLLAALGADVVTRDSRGSRRIAVTSLSDGPMSTDLRQGELITAVHVPRLGPDDRCAYVKFLPKTADDYATVSAAVLLHLAGLRITGARVFCGAVGPVPVECGEAAALLVGRMLDDADLTAGVPEAVRAAVSPSSDHRGSSGYKARMAGAFVGRAVRAAAAADPVGVRAGRSSAPTGNQER